MSSLPDLSGIGGSNSDDIDVSNIDISDDSQDEDQEEQGKTPMNSRRSSAMLNDFLDEIEFDNSTPPAPTPPLPPRTKPSKPLKPPKSSKPKINRKSQEITAEALDNFFDDVMVSNTPKKKSEDDIMDVLAREGRREVVSGGRDWIDSVFDEAEEESFVRKEIETIEAPPGVDPFVFASLPYEMQKEQREIYERERQDRELAQRLAKEEQQHSAKKKKKKKKKVKRTGLKPPPGVDPTTFSALPVDIQREVIEAHRGRGSQVEETIVKPTNVQCPFCKSIISIPFGSRLATCPECDQTVAAPSVERGRSTISCIHCSTEMRVPRGAREAVCPTCWKKTPVRRDSEVSTVGLQQQQQQQQQQQLQNNNTTRTSESRVKMTRIKNVPVMYKQLDKRRRQLLEPLSSSLKGYVECVLWRSGSEFRMYLIEHDEENDISSHRFLLSGKSDMFTRGLNLIISMSPDASRESAAYIGKCRGDTNQQRYCLYDSGLAPKNAPKQYIHDVDASVILRKQLADIYYILPHTKGGTRKMIVLLPKPETRWTPTGNDDSMLAAYNRGDTSKLFVLNRALWAFKESTKNFTLLWNGRQRVMAFGKVAKDQFRIMMKHPFSYVQAFALCVSACVAKIG
eukprot:g3252.t1